MSLLLLVTKALTQYQLNYWNYAYKGKPDITPQHSELNKLQVLPTRSSDSISDQRINSQLNSSFDGTST